MTKKMDAIVHPYIGMTDRLVLYPRSDMPDAVWDREDGNSLGIWRVTFPGPLDGP